MSVQWASQIIYHLSASASGTPFQAGVSAFRDVVLEPDQDLVQLLSFAIDQYFMVMLVFSIIFRNRPADGSAYTASFLVLAWQHGAIDSEY